MTTEEKILEYFKKYELSNSGDVIIYTTEFVKVASEIVSLIETELNKFAFEQGLYSYDKEKIKKAVDRYLSNKQKP